MAVQGKLVPQDPNAEPAKALLEKIKAEKAELVKQKKIKADKNPSHIFRGEDNLFYETVGTETKCIQDEIPFDIPDSWEWVRLGEVISISSGKNLTSKEMVLTGIYPVYGGNGITGYHDNFNVTKSTLVIGRVGFYCGSTHITENKAWVTDNAFITSFNEKYINIKWLKFYIDFINPRTKTSSTAQPVISGKLIYPLFFPFPPLEEQKRIVEKVQSLQPLIAQYAEADTALQNLEKSFPENLKKSLLQWAVQGKLVPQDPNAEPAKALLEKIKAEKTELAQKELNGQKKIKADKPPSIIFRGEDNLFYETVGTETKCIQDEIPFDIPDSWEWVRLGEIVYNHGQKTPDAQFSYIDIGSIDNINQKLNEQENILLPEKAPSRARKIVNKGDILYATVRPYLHNMCIIDKDFTYEPIASTGFAVLTCYKNIYNKFLFYYLLSPTFDSYANHNENSKGVAYPAINDTKLYKGLIPLPPLEEQKRITQKLQSLMPLCVELENKEETK